MCVYRAWSPSRGVEIGYNSPRLDMNDVQFGQQCSDQAVNVVVVANVRKVDSMFRSSIAKSIWECVQRDLLYSPMIVFYPHQLFLGFGNAPLLLLLFFFFGLATIAATTTTASSSWLCSVTSSIWSGLSDPSGLVQTMMMMTARLAHVTLSKCARSRTTN